MPMRATVCELCGMKMPERYVCACGMKYRYVSEGAIDGTDEGKTIEVEGDDHKWYPVPLSVGRKLIHAGELARQIVGYLDYNERPSTFAEPRTGTDPLDDAAHHLVSSWNKWDGRPSSDSFGPLQAAVEMLAAVLNGTAGHGVTAG